MARNSVCKKVVREDLSGIDFNFANGQTRAFDLAKVPTDSVAYVRGLLNGFSQKIGDDYAGVGGDIEEAIENTESMIERLYGGEWGAEREPAGPRPSLVADAVVRVARAEGKTFDETVTRAKYIGKDAADQRKRALANPKVKAAYDAIRAEAMAARAAESAKAAGTATDDIGGLV